MHGTMNVKFTNGMVSVKITWYKQLEYPKWYQTQLLVGCSMNYYYL